MEEAADTTDLRASGAERARIVAVDDEVLNLDLIERSLRRRFEVITAQNPVAALEILRDLGDVAVLLADYRMPDLNGADFLNRARKLVPDAKRVIITGYADADNLITAVNSGQVHYLIKKPWNHQELHQIVEQLVHSHRLERENRRLLGELQAANSELRAKERLLVNDLDERSGELVRVTGELDQLKRELDVLSFRDSLTGLYNHQAFHLRLREEIARAQRYNQPLSVLFGDIDRFADLNHDLGYQLGDEILRGIADLVRTDAANKVRDSDIVARYSGEEFVFLLPETTKSGAVTKANRLREAIAGHPFPGRKQVSMSFGVASYPDDHADFDGLISCAQAALENAKRAGRNRVHFYTDSANDSHSRAAPREATALVLTQAVIVEPDRVRTYHDRIGEVISILQRDRAIACLYVDLLRLRRIENELGLAQHATIYDRVGVILEGMRGSTLRPGDLVCRTNDDDAYLCILSPKGNQTENAAVDLEELAMRVADSVNQAVSAEVRELIRDEPRITVGYARVLNNTMVRPERLVNRLINEATASAKLYRERASERDKAHLQEIILTESLTPVYQPIVHIASGSIFGYEALTRGPRQTSMESPATLFSVADEVDLTFELDRACFRGALRGAVGLEPIHRLFVNLLPMSFYDSGFIELEVSHLLEAAAITPANIVFEITERLAIDNFTAFRRALATYTAMGFGVAIDDVGTRHSNLETVMSLRPHFIKISDVLTKGVARSTVKREMLRSLGHIAEAIDAVMVAEGIETVDDLHVLCDLGVRYGQGFFLARPAPPFTKLKASVRRVMRNLASGPRAPIPAPPAEVDEDGEMIDGVFPVNGMAHGSGEFAVCDDDGVPRPVDGASERIEVSVGGETWQSIRLDDSAEPNEKATRPSLLSALASRRNGDKPPPDEGSSN